MNSRDFLGKLRIDDQELASRLAFYELGAEDLARLAALRPFAEAHTDAIVEAFYELLLRHPETRKFFPDETTVRRVKKSQRDYFVGLFSGVVDKSYVEHRARVGQAHERIGMAPKWYLGAYRRYMALLLERLMAHFTDPAEAHAAFQSAQKLVYFDMALAIDTYVAANLEALKRHQAAIRELSTPVIRVHDRILLLPLVGTIDSLRAHQIMETVLTKVTDEQAKVLILDIAGVPVVDTKVADHLLKTTAAVRLVGAKSIITGISAQVARTIIQLGVDISAMDTQSRLSDGIELALSLVGKAITTKGAWHVARGIIPILRVGSNLLATVHVELRDAVAEGFQEDVLTELERRRASGLVIDVSGLDVVDTYVARILAETGRMAKLMGTETVLVGIRPDVAATLIRMGYNMEGVHTALNVDDGIETLAKLGAASGKPGADGKMR